MTIQEAVLWATAAVVFGNELVSLFHRRKTGRLMERQWELRYFIMRDSFDTSRNMVCIDLLTFRACRTFTDVLYATANEYDVRRCGPNHWEWRETPASWARNSEERSYLVGEEAKVSEGSWERLAIFDAELEGRYESFLKDFATLGLPEVERRTLDALKESARWRQQSGRRAGSILNT